MSLFSARVETKNFLCKKTLFAEKSFCVVWLFCFSFGRLHLLSRVSWLLTFWTFPHPGQIMIYSSRSSINSSSLAIVRGCAGLFAYSTDPTQETSAARWCRLYGSHPATWMNELQQLAVDHVLLLRIIYFALRQCMYIVHDFWSDIKIQDWGIPWNTYL